MVRLVAASLVVLALVASCRLLGVDDKVPCRNSDDCDDGAFCSPDFLCVAIAGEGEGEGEGEGDASEGEGDVASEGEGDVASEGEGDVASEGEGVGGVVGEGEGAGGVVGEGEGEGAVVVVRDFTVDTEVDDEDAVAGDGACVTATGACSLRAAIAEANQATTSTIRIADGLLEIKLIGAPFDVGASVDIEGSRTTVSQINGNAIDRIFVVNSGGSFEMHNVTLTNGVATDDVGAGALWVQAASSVTLEGVDFTANGASVSGNVPDGHGGAAFIENTGAFDCGHCGFFDNALGGGGSGGALALHDVDTWHIHDSVFDGNHSDGAGGALDVVGGDPSGVPNEIDRTLFVANNAARNASAIDLRAPFGRPIDITNATFASNTSDDSGGGFLFVLADQWEVDLRFSTFFDNAALSATSNGHMALRANLFNLGPICTGATPTSSGNNVAAAAGTCGLTSASNDNVAAALTLAAPAQFGTCFSHVVVITTTSAPAAIGAARNGNCPGLDQCLGIRGNQCDAGAFEHRVND